MNLEKDIGSKLTHFESFFSPDLPSTGKVFEPQSTDLYWDEQDPSIYEIYKKLVNQFWHADEVSLKGDKTDFIDTASMTEQKKTLFYRAISQLIVLDTVASKVMSAVTGFIKNPAIVALFDYQSSQETIHNESYTYILSSLISKEEVQRIKEETKKDPIFLEATMPIIEVFDEFLIKCDKDTVKPLDIVKVLVGMLALEGIRFTNGFVPFYQFNRENILQGIGTIIQFINRDETQHSFGIVLVIQKIIEEYSLDRKEIEAFTQELFLKVVVGEKKLSASFFEGYAGINTVLAQQYVEFRANSLLGNLGFEQSFETVRNPMRWITAFDSTNMSNQKTDFFEKKENNYVKVDKKENGFDDL